MRPLSSNTQTALLFYLAFTGLLLLVTFWPQAIPASGKIINNLKNDNLEEIDLRYKVNQLEEYWQNSLIKSGYKPENIYKLRDEQLLKRQEGVVKIKWVSSYNTIVLPDGADEKELLRLGSEWQSLNNSVGFITDTPKWGYINHYLWLRLTSHFQIRTKYRQVTLPVNQLTLVQPIAELTNKLPGLVPQLPPELDTGELLRLLPELAEKVPVDKVPDDLKQFKTPLNKKARIAIIIDDVGFVKGPADEMLKIPEALTWAVLPGAPYTRKYTEAAKERGFEILLHLPLEPLSGAENPGPGIIKRNWTKEEISRQLKKDLAELPDAVGINNHMGSAGTSDERFMKILMSEIKQENKFFIDSFTTSKSVAEKFARIYQVPFAKRQVFIDNENDLESKKEAIQELIKIALRDGEAIGIAHVREGTAKAIKEMIPEFVKNGIEIVPVSELVK